MAADVTRGDFCDAAIRIHVATREQHLPVPSPLLRPPFSVLITRSPPDEAPSFMCGATESRQANIEYKVQAMKHCGRDLVIEGARWVKY